MLDIAAQNAPVPAPDAAAGGRKVLKMIPHDRMAGSVPAWVPAAAENAARPAESAINGQTSETGFKTALAGTAAPGRAAAPRPGTAAQQPFGFGDLLDMVNPLQHIPVLSQLYRDITGDSIRPVARIIGGGVYGGPAGAAGGLVNVVLEEETGRDLAGNAAALLRGEKPAYKSDRADPEAQLETVLAGLENRENAARRDLPAELLAFAAAPETAAGQTAARALHNDNSRYNS